MSTTNYDDAGVNRSSANRAKQRIFDLARGTFTPGAIGDIGFFGSAFQVQGFDDPILISHTDGVGTKTRVAGLMGNFDSIGVDIVHHCVNDILTCRARPLFFLDYIGLGSMVPETVEGIVEGITKACKAVGCALIGGETAELADIYHAGDLDLVGFIVGAVEKTDLPQIDNVSSGDVLLGLPSSGLHTNGFTLVRKVFNIDNDPSVLRAHVPELNGSLGECLLIPHRCYYNDLSPVLREIKAMAHITGGGFFDNIARCLPVDVSASIDASTWEVPPLFRLIQERGKVTTEEMFSVFNMGVGMVLIAAPEDVAAIQESVAEAWVIGEVVARDGGDAVSIEKVRE
ncbi:MAG: phosphoribosylformylglycinamidine cyclo-ligase [SAR202 cluster bacterium]|nr:phosphoribosylformylglycinamidine cyclo-ligase [SAR202 cluster bacterium]